MDFRSYGLHQHAHYHIVISESKNDALASFRIRHEWRPAFLDGKKS